MSPSDVATVRPRWMMRASARTGPVSLVSARTKFNFSSSVVQVAFCKVEKIAQPSAN